LKRLENRARVTLEDELTALQSVLTDASIIPTEAA